ncbi:LysR family transcriptional regulator [Specibacter sp. RAF43]|uniref:LysR family transcriptional regulator n=1 Tax=Specibacter sp. RAF43 TaxID=3233057 RepID=UPI003F9A637A
MNFRRVEYFLAVVAAGTITAAAEKLYIAQPALSRQIKTLERELRLSLFESHGNRLVLTPAGHAFIPAARRLIVETRGLESAADALRTGRVSKLVVAATSSSVRSFLAPFIATTGPDDPAIVTMRTRHFEVSELLLRGADFAISPLPAEPGLSMIPLGSVPLKAHVAVDHQWAREGRQRLPLEAVCENLVILPSHESVSRHLLDSAMNRAGLRFKQTIECDDGETIIALAAAGKGIGLTTDLGWQGTHPIRILEPGAGDAPSILRLPLHAAWMPGHFAEETIRSLIDGLVKFLEMQGDMVPSELPRTIT